MTLTNEMIEKYLKNPLLCPFCKKTNIIARKPEADDDFIRIDVECHICKKEWTEVYTLTTIEEPEVL